MEERSVQAEREKPVKRRLILCALVVCLAALAAAPAPAIGPYCQYSCWSGGCCNYRCYEDGRTTCGWAGYICRIC
jgi:hypothetical protein